MDPESLRWTPVLSGPASRYGSPYKRDSGPFFVSRSPPPNSSPTKKSNKKQKGRQTSSSESSSEEEEEIPQVSKNKSSKKQVVDKTPKNKKDRKNVEEKGKKSADNQLLSTRQRTVGGKKVEEKLKKGKKGRKKKSDGESSTSSSDENKKKVDSISNSSSSEDSSTSEEDEKEEKVSRNRKSFGRKVATTSTTTTSVSKRQNASGSNKRPNKHSGEYEGLEGGENTNIFSSTSRHQTTNDVAKVRDNAASKSRSVATNNSTEKGPAADKAGILNRAIGRLLELRQTDDPKSRPKSCEREANDADVEDEGEERVVNGKVKVALNFESPTKKVKKRSPDLASRRFKRAAASKACDRIARESRGSINLDSSSSSDSDDDSSKKVDKVSTSKASTAIKSTPEVAKVKSKLDIFSRKLERSVSKVEAAAMVVPVDKPAAAIVSTKNVRHSDTSDFEDENVTLASKFKKGVGAKSSRKKADTNLIDSVKKLSTVKRKLDEEVSDTSKKPLPVVGSGSKDTKKPNQDQV